MNWAFVVALLLAVPLILLPVAYIWYMNIGGILSWIGESRKKRQPKVARGVDSTVEIASQHKIRKAGRRREG